MQECRAFGVLRCVFRCLCPLFRFALDALPLKYALFRILRAFLARFGVVVWVCLSCVLCVACVAFCARGELGGFMACGVFASVFRFSSSFVLSLSLCFSFVSLCLCCSLLVLLPALFVLVAFCGCVVVSFSLTDYTQKERAQGFAFLCPLLSCYVCLDACIVIKIFRCRCFCFFQFVRFVLPCDAACIRRLARSYFDFLRHYVDITYNRSAFLK